MYSMLLCCRSSLKFIHFCTEWNIQASFLQMETIYITASLFYTEEMRSLVEFKYNITIWVQWIQNCNTSSSINQQLALATGLLNAWWRHNETKLSECWSKPTHLQRKITCFVNNYEAFSLKGPTGKVVCTLLPSAGWSLTGQTRPSTPQWIVFTSKPSNTRFTLFSAIQPS